MSTLDEVMEEIVDYRLHLEQGAGLICHVMYEDDINHPDMRYWAPGPVFYGLVYGSDAQPERDWRLVK